MTAQPSPKELKALQDLFCPESYRKFFEAQMKRKRKEEEQALREEYEYGWHMGVLHSVIKWAQRREKSDRELKQLRQQCRLSLKELAKKFEEHSASQDPTLYQTVRVYCRFWNLQRTADELSKKRKRPLSREAVRKRIRKFEALTGLLISTGKKSMRDGLRIEGLERQRRQTERMYEEVDKKLTRG